jgi:hypothetical protein
MAKVRKIPQAFEGTRGVPGQYTTDPDIATPDQIASIGKALDKAKRIGRGEQVRTPMDRTNPLTTSLSPAGVSGDSSRRAPAGTSGGIQATGPDIARTPAKINYKKGDAGSPIKTRFQRLDKAKLNEQQAAVLKLMEQKLAVKNSSPDEDPEFKLFAEVLMRKQTTEPEQNRLRSVFRRFDNLYHPNIMTLGGADHWADDPTARTSGRAHVSVNVHAAYVNIPASLQAVMPVINYVPEGMDQQARERASNAERLFFRWAEENEFDLLLEDACFIKALYGYTAAKIYWDAEKKVPRVRIVESPENLYLGFGTSDFSRLDWSLYTYGMSPQAVEEDYGVSITPVQQGGKWYNYTASTHDDPIASIYLNQYERNPLRRETPYEMSQVEVYDYWYKVPGQPGKAPTVRNAIFVGNTLVKDEAHVEFRGEIPYVLLSNAKVPGSPYGKPELYDVEQLLREKDERITNQAQMIHSVIGGQMFQLVGPEAPDEIPANAIPKPGKMAAPGPGNEIRSISPFIPQFQIEDYNKRIDREIAVVTGLNDLLLGLAPSGVLGSSRAIASLVANYEARIAPKRKLLYSWIKQVWKMSAQIWETKVPDVISVFEGNYRLDITPPELTPRDTLELAQTAINLVQNRIWSASRAMDRVGVEDPEGEMTVIRDEQTDATLNPSAVMAMANLVQMFQQMQMQQKQNAQQQFADQQASVQNVARTLQAPAAGTQSLNQPENQAQPPAEAIPSNALAPNGAPLAPGAAPTNEVPA